MCFVTTSKRRLARDRLVAVISIQVASGGENCRQLVSGVQSRSVNGLSKWRNLALEDHD